MIPTNKVVVNAPNGPYAAGSTPEYTALIVDAERRGIPASRLDALRLTIVNTLSGQVVNSCQDQNILNTNRGTVDEEGLVTVTLQRGDTSMDDVPGDSDVLRSLQFLWSYGGNRYIGLHQVDFQIIRLTDVAIPGFYQPWLDFSDRRNSGLRLLGWCG